MKKMKRQESILNEYDKNHTQKRNLGMKTDLYM